MKTSLGSPEQVTVHSVYISWARYNDGSVRSWCHHITTGYSLTSQEVRTTVTTLLKIQHLGWSTFYNLSGEKGPVLRGILSFSPGSNSHSSQVHHLLIISSPWPPLPCTMITACILAGRDGKARYQVWLPCTLSTGILLGGQGSRYSTSQPHILPSLGLDLMVPGLDDIKSFESAPLLESYSL